MIGQIVVDNWCSEPPQTRSYSLQKHLVSNVPTQQAWEAPFLLVPTAIFWSSIWDSSKHPWGQCKPCAYWYLGTVAHLAALKALSRTNVVVMLYNGRRIFSYIQYLIWMIIFSYYYCIFYCCMSFIWYSLKYVLFHMTSEEGSVAWKSSGWWIILPHVPYFHHQTYLGCQYCVGLGERHLQTDKRQHPNETLNMALMLVDMGFGREKKMSAFFFQRFVCSTDSLTIRKRNG